MSDDSSFKIDNLDRKTRRQRLGSVGDESAEAWFLLLFGWCCREYTLISAQILTGDRFRDVELVFAKDIAKLAVRYNPELAERMVEAGATVYLYGCFLVILTTLCAKVKLNVLRDKILTTPNTNIK